MLPNKHSGTTARLADPPSLGRTSLHGSHGFANDALTVWLAADELLNFYGIVAVHDLSRVIHLFARSCCENEDTSAPHPLDVRIGLVNACPDCLSSRLKTTSKSVRGVLMAPSPDISGGSPRMRISFRGNALASRSWTTWSDTLGYLNNPTAVFDMSNLRLRFAQNQDHRDFRFRY
jgi:hypothetical protein